MDTLNLILNICVSITLVASAQNNKTSTVHVVNNGLEQVYSQIQALTAKVERVQTECSNELNILRSEYSKFSGGVYTRWGSTSCADINGTSLVYTGFMGGSMFTDKGAAANHLCMPRDPEFLPARAGGGFVYGTEYQDDFHGQMNMHNTKAPCAVCRSSRTSVLMIPGRKHCYGNWTMEYTGSLASGGYSQDASTEYVCLDSEPEALGSQNITESNAYGAMLYFVNTRCGSLPCPPYKHEATLPCVVCSI